MSDLLYLALFTPLIGFIILMLLSDQINRTLTNWIGCGTIFISFLCFTTLLANYTYADLEPLTYTLYNWIPFKGIDAHFILRLDPLSILMTMIITGVSFLIHFYSIGYIDHEKDYARYFACLNFFVFAMLLLVLAGDLLLLFVGWEGVGLASYLLIGYWYEKPSAAKAATKAFVVNRIGDLGFLLGLLLTYYTFGTSNVGEILTKAQNQFSLGSPVLILLTALYFIGSIGKSAQVPLHVWLPDAMEGPTPVSALIHAATMVTAGVYLIVRLHPVFMLAPATLNLVGIIGGTTALFAAICATAQNDLKRVLAYSTISQLGYMFLACSVGAFYSAMFHLTTHAFIKALLFLSAGNVIHMMKGNTDMNKMGGLYKNFPYTHWFFLIGSLALAGVPPLAAFFSKEVILDQEYLAGFKTFFLVSLIAAIFTGFYLIRAYCLTFLGIARVNHRDVKEAPPVMLLPVFILAVLSCIGGFLGFTFKHRMPVLESFLAEIGITLAKQEDSIELIKSPETWIATTGVMLGILLAALFYTRLTNKVGTPIPFLKNGFYFDEIYDNLLVQPLKMFRNFLSRFIEPAFFVGMIRKLVTSIQDVASWLQKFQSGQIRSYISWMIFGMVFMLIYLVF